MGRTAMAAKKGSGAASRFQDASAAPSQIDHVRMASAAMAASITPRLTRRHRDREPPWELLLNSVTARTCRTATGYDCTREEVLASSGPRLEGGLPPGCLAALIGRAHV